MAVVVDLPFSSNNILTFQNAINYDMNILYTEGRFVAC